MFSDSSSSKIVITFPDKLWLGALSRQYNYYQFEVKAFVPVSLDPFIGNSLIRISGNKPGQLLQSIKEHPSLISLTVMEETDDLLALNTQTKDQFLLLSIVKNFILIHLPFTIINGKAEVKISSSRENIDQFIDDLTERGLSVEIKSIGQFNEDLLKKELTSRQFYIYQKAKELGYYDAPRKLSLTLLAENLNVAKSSLSTMLQRIHSKLLGYQA